MPPPDYLPMLLMLMTMGSVVLWAMPDRFCRQCDHCKEVKRLSEAKKQAVDAHDCDDPDCDGKE